VHIGIFGLSGSGKTTLSSRIESAHPEYTYTSASSLLRVRGQVTERKSLAVSNLSENQDVLVEAYNELKRIKKNTVIELHAVIETSDTLFWIPATTLKNLALDVIVILKTDPSSIAMRRIQDKTKDRAIRPGPAIAELQENAVTYLKKIYGQGQLYIADEDTALELIDGVMKAAAADT
jgi:adenylate kinase